MEEINYPEGIKPLVELGIPIVLKKKRDGSHPEAVTTYEGIEIHISYGTYHKTYGFRLYDCRIEHHIGGNKCRQIEKDMNIDRPNDVHKPHKGRIEKHFAYIKKYHDELWKYYEIRDAQRCVEIGEAVALMEEIKNHRIYSRYNSHLEFNLDLDHIIFKTECAKLIINFQDFDYTRKTFEVDRYDIERILGGPVNAIKRFHERGM
jgi:hypothetical protein